MALLNISRLTRYYKLSNVQAVRHYHKVSKLFQPLSVKPKDATVTKDEAISISQKLLMDTGIISLRSNGMFALLPLGERVMMKLTKLIDKEMSCIGAQRLSLPLLTSGDLWKKTGRWESTGQELLKIEDRHGKEYVLSPTHEEAITSLMSEIYPFSFRQLPLRLYQINSKFRDEMKPRFGLLRCREFIMKDLYTFDNSVEAAHDTYQEICSAYDRIFHRLRIPFLKVTGDCGSIGGTHSHEYHYISPTGEDTLCVCDNCGNSKNAELVSSDKSDSCDKCGSHVHQVAGIEVGHTFLLGTKYSKPLKALYQNESGKPELLQMGCYGIGVSRLLAASVEVLAEDKNIKWPWEIVPFKICLIGPKKGSKEASSALWVDHLAEVMSGMPGLLDEVVVDDRDRLTIGKRVMEAKQSGYPFIIVVGKRACEMVPMFELLDCTTGKSEFLSHKMLMNWVRELP